MKPQTQILLNELKAARWFCAVGTPPPEESRDIKWVTQWMEATAHMLDDLWPVINYQHGAELERAVKSISRDRIREWRAAHEELGNLARALVKEKLDEVRGKREALQNG